VVSSLSTVGEYEPNGILIDQVYYGILNNATQLLCQLLTPATPSLLLRAASGISSDSGWHLQVGTEWRWVCMSE